MENNQINKSGFREGQLNQASNPKQLSQIVIGIAIIFLISISVLGGFLIYRNAKNSHSSSLEPSNALQNLQPVSTTTSLADWQTYRSDQFGFQIKYPADWRLELQSDNKGKPQFSFYPPPNISAFLQILPLGGGGVVSNYDEGVPQVSNLMLGSVQAIQYDYKLRTRVQISSPLPNWSSKDNSIEILGNQQTEVLKVMLHSLEFFPPQLAPDIKDWKTYEVSQPVNQIRYSVSYPKDWSLTEDINYGDNLYIKDSAGAALSFTTPALDKKDLVGVQTSVVVDGHPAFLTNGVYNGLGFSLVQFTEYNFKNFDITMTYNVGHSDYYKGLLKQLLKTFQFVGVDLDTNQWYTALSYDLGIRLKYPNKWMVQYDSKEKLLISDAPRQKIYSEPIINDKDSFVLIEKNNSCIPTNSFRPGVAYSGVSEKVICQDGLKITLGKWDYNPDNNNVAQAFISIVNSVSKFSPLDEYPNEY